MNYSCQTVVLHNQPNNHITFCQSCRAVHWQFNNILVSLQPEDVPVFLEALQQADFSQYSISFPDGTLRILIDTYHFDIRVSLTLAELLAVRKAFTEACSMLHLFQSVTHPYLN